MKDIIVFPKKKKKKKAKISDMGPERYNNLSEDEKQKLIEYRKKYYKIRKNALRLSVLCTA